MFEFVFYVMLLQSAMAADNSAPPVMLWGISVPTPPAPAAAATPSVFKPLSSLEFSETLKPLLQHHMVIAYVAQNLTTKDFLCQLAHPTRSCYGFLQELLPRRYYSQVQQPLHVLQHLMAANANGIRNWRHINLTAESELPSPSVECRIGQLLLFNFSDTLSQREQNLLAHDRFIADTNRQLRFCPVVQLYTAHGDGRLKFVPAKRAHRVKRFDVKKSNNLTILLTDYCVFAFHRILYAKEIRDDQDVHYAREELKVVENDPLNVELHNVEDITKGFKFSLKLIGTGALTFSVLDVSGSWIITSIEALEKTFHSIEYQFFNKDSAFCCNNPTFFSEDGSRLTIFKWHLEVAESETKLIISDDYKLKSCWQCQYYLSFVTGQVLLILFMMSGILTCGISMIWDIGRNSRMSNPLEPDPPMAGT